MQVDVIVSHPAKQANIYHRPLAAQEAGLATKFLTGAYFAESTTQALAKVRIVPQFVTQLMRRRSQPGLLAGNVTTLAPSIAAECILRPMGRIRAWDQVHDFCASKWLLAHRPVGPAVVHVFQGSCLSTIGAARQLGLSTIYEVTLPKPDAQNDPENSSARSHLLREIAFADVVLSQSPFSTDWLVSMGLPRAKILDFPLGVDTEFFSPFQKNDGGVFRLLFVGRVQKRKGLEVLLQAWNRLSLSNAELVIVGTPTEYLNEARQIASKSVHFAGFVPTHQLLNHYRSADAFVVPSYSEGACNVVYEAMACGLPCIVSTAARSVVRQGTDGMIFDTGSVDELAACITRLSSNPSLRNMMGRQARERALTLGWSSFRGQLGRVYSSLLGRVVTKAARLE